MNDEERKQKQNERAARWRARKRGEIVPLQQPGPKQGFKQSPDHIEKRKRFGPDHHSWLGDQASERAGRCRALRRYDAHESPLAGILPQSVTTLTETRSTTNRTTSPSSAVDATCATMDVSNPSMSWQESISQKLYDSAGIKPYYSTDSVLIFNNDCRDILPHLPPANALITDPPYGIGLITKTSDFRDSERFDRGESLRATFVYPDDPESIRALIREVIPLALTRADRGMIFSGPAMLFAYPEPRAIGAVFTPNGAGRCAWGFQCVHPVLYYGKDPYLQDGKGGQPNSLRDEQPNREKIDHPCPKPMRWMRWAVTRASREGETVLDLFAGSGTTLRAARDLGRRAIGIEIEERYCEIAVRRLQQAVLPLDIAS